MQYLYHGGRLLPRSRWNISRFPLRFFCKIPLTEFVHEKRTARTVRCKREQGSFVNHAFRKTTEFEGIGIIDIHGVTAK